MIRCLCIELENALIMHIFPQNFKSKQLLYVYMFFFCVKNCTFTWVCCRFELRCSASKQTNMFSHLYNIWLYKCSYIYFFTFPQLNIFNNTSILSIAMCNKVHKQCTNAYHKAIAKQLNVNQVIYGRFSSGSAYRC